jgi:hypothetical protein
MSPMPALATFRFLHYQPIAPVRTAFEQPAMPPMPLFCRLEHRMHRKVPLSLRLGSLEHVNTLECKPNYAP